VHNRTRHDCCGRISFALAARFHFHDAVPVRGEPTREAPDMTDNDTDAKARTTARGLIQGYIGPDHKVIDIAAFYSALVQALREASKSPKR